MLKAPEALSWQREDTMVGIIGGSGLYQIEGIGIRKNIEVKTPYGSPSDSYIIGELSDKTIVFLPRHGKKHAVPPHKINYRANIWGFKELGVERILSVGAVGGLTPRTKPGSIVIPDQIIDMTRARHATFFEGKSRVVHIDFTEPYCPELRKNLLDASRISGIPLKKSGTYICTEGPRLETKAEIQFFSRIGADVVGMTGMPEASLAREAEICYAGIAVVTNYAAGLTGNKLTATEVVSMMNKTIGSLQVLLKEVFRNIPSRRGCACGNALKEATI